MFHQEQAYYVRCFASPSLCSQEGNYLLLSVRCSQIVRDRSPAVPRCSARRAKVKACHSDHDLDPAPNTSTALLDLRCRCEVVRFRPDRRWRHRNN